MLVHNRKVTLSCCTLICPYIVSVKNLKKVANDEKFTDNPKRKKSSYYRS